MSKTDFQLATEALKRSSDDYRRSLLASGGIREAIKRAMGEADPLISQVRSARDAAQGRLGTVFADSMDELKGVSDPGARERIRSMRSSQYGTEASSLGEQLRDLGASRDVQADKFGSIFDTTTRAKEFGVSQQQKALDRAFEGRFDDLTRREKEASIAASNRSNRTGPGNITFEDQVSNPLLAFLAATGGRGRVAKQDGGFDFFDKEGRPITVEQAAAMTPGGTKAALLQDSAAKQDTDFMQKTSGKPPSVTQATTGLYASRIKQSNDIFDQLSGYTQNLDPIKYNAQLKSPQFFNFLRSKDFQSYDQAQRNFINAVLRRESGAVISPAEFDNARLQYFPQPGDKPQVLAQKKANRKLVEQQFIQGSGSSYNNPSASAGGTDDAEYLEYLRLTGQQPR